MVENGRVSPGAAGGESVNLWDQFRALVSDAPNVHVTHEVVVAGRQELLELTDRMRALDGVATTETFFYLEMWKQLYDWGAHSPVAEPSS